MNQSRAIIVGASIISATIAFAVVGLPIIKHYKAYNRASETYEFQAMCENSEMLADDWVFLGPLGPEEVWRSKTRDDCQRFRLWLMRQP